MFSEYSDNSDTLLLYKGKARERVFSKSSHFSKYSDNSNNSDNFPISLYPIKTLTH